MRVYGHPGREWQHLRKIDTRMMNQILSKHDGLLLVNRKILLCMC